MKSINRGIIATVHSRQEKELEETEVMALLNDLDHQFAGTFLVISDVTHPKLFDLFHAHPSCKTMVIPARGAGDARRKAVFAAKETYPELTSFQLCDFDRLLTWYALYPTELAQISQLDIGSNTYCILGRTAQAFESHPETWKQTESLVNQVAEAYFKIPHVDITAGSEIFSASLIEGMLQGNQGRMNDGEWPSKVLASGGHLMYHACAGLCYAPRNEDCMTDDPARQLMERLQLAAAITKSFYEEGK